MVGRSGPRFGELFWPIGDLLHDMESESRTDGSKHERLVLQAPRDERSVSQVAPTQIEPFFNRLLGNARAG